MVITFECLYLPKQKVGMRRVCGEVGKSVNHRLALRPEP